MMKSPVAAATIGAAALSNPIWLEWIPSAWQALTLTGGGIVVGLTIWNKILEIKQRRRDLRENR